MFCNLQATFVFLALSALTYTVLVVNAQQRLPENERMTRTARRCRINACFAIDGSESLHPSQFRIQRDFVSRIVASISEGNRVNVAAVQYGLINYVISPFTNDIPAFRRDLREATFASSNSTFVGGGILYCFGQLRLRRRPLSRAKIVLLGTGDQDFGMDPAVVADRFRDEGGEVFAIAVGNSDERILQKIAGRRANVFQLGDRRDFKRLLGSILPALCA